MTFTSDNSFLEIRDSFSRHFSEGGYRAVAPIPMQNADSKKSFLRSINSRPAYEYIKFNRMPFGFSRICVAQPVVRPEDFLDIDFDPLCLNQGTHVVTQYRCGMFEMLAAWHSGPIVDMLDGKQSGGSSFFPLVLNALTFLRDQLKLDPSRMWFSLWPGGKVANGKGYIPPATDCLEFLRDIWGAKAEQIAWDPSNVWPDSKNQDVLDPDRTGLIAPRLEMYYKMSDFGSASCYPKDVSECAELGYMELLSAIPLKWINDKTSGEFAEIPDEKMVSEVAFGLERSAACVERVARVRDIGFYREFRSSINSVLQSPLFLENDEKSYFAFCKVVDRLRLLIMASYQGVDFSVGGRGATLKLYSRELFEILRSMGLDNRSILLLEEKSIQYLSKYYPFLNSPECQAINDFVFQQLNPGFAMGKKYYCSPSGGVQGKDIILRDNRGPVRRSKVK